MSNIGLIDVDGHNFPNFALMKIAAYHKSKDDKVEWANIGTYERTYFSKIFSFSPDFIAGGGHSKLAILMIFNPVMDFYAVLILIIKNNLKDLYHNLLKN